MQRSQIGSVSGVDGAPGNNAVSKSKSFLLLLFKKEGLP
jgi:hypothetical protein